MNSLVRPIKASKQQLLFTRNVMLRKYFGMNCPFNNLCCYKVLCCVVVIVVRNLRQYVLRVHSQSGSSRRTEMRIMRKSESAKMQKKQQH